MLRKADIVTGEISSVKFYLNFVAALWTYSLSNFLFIFLWSLIMSEFLGLYASKDESSLCLVELEKIGRVETQMALLFDFPYVSFLLAS